MVCELLTAAQQEWRVQAALPHGNLSGRHLIAFPAMARPSHSTGDVRDPLSACEMVLDIIGDLFTHRRQLKHLVFDDRIVSLLGKLPILGCFVPEIVSPVHVIQSN
jgi:hypothetical protein